jgi:DNA-binding response OmpR family regulator
MHRVLIVDDEKDIILLFKMVLEMNGFKADTYTDPSLVLSNFKPNSYSLLLLDIKMPNMNGFELYRKIKKKDNEVKVCFLTAGYTHYALDVDIYNTLGAECFIQKPIANEELIGRVKNMLMST